MDGLIMIPKKFKIEHEHIDFNSFTMDSEKHGFNTIVIATACSNSYKPITRVGRLVQVRKKAGAFGTDVILIRQADGGLQSWENVTFCKVQEEYKELYQSFFKGVNIDKPDKEYSINNEYLAKGFIVKDMDCNGGKIHSFDMCISKDKISFSEVRTNDLSFFLNLPITINTIIQQLRDKDCQRVEFLRGMLAAYSEIVETPKGWVKKQVNDFSYFK